MENTAADLKDSTPRLLGSAPVNLDLIKFMVEPEAEGALDIRRMAQIVVGRVTMKALVRTVATTACTAEAEGALDIRRMAQITFGRATDHAGEVVMMPNLSFDISKTIFHSLEGVVPRAVIGARLAITPFWSDKAALRITRGFESVPAAPRHEQPLLDFMQIDCNFAMEHADGSFMDHLKFCFEYSFAHYKERSPRVLLLHSIMGVGTNFFPMEASKIPQLQALVSDFEFQQIAAFPSVLRLLYAGDFLRELEGLDSAALNGLERIIFHRVIDNERMEMRGDDFWDQLNYQLIHLLDFLPAASWKLEMDDSFLRNFSAIHAILTRAGKLRCKVDFDATEGQSSKAKHTPMSLGKLIRTILPNAMTLRMSEKAMKKFSANIGHSLEYEVFFSSDVAPQGGDEASKKID